MPAFLFYAHNGRGSEKQQGRAAESALCLRIGRAYTRPRALVSENHVRM